MSVAWTSEGCAAHIPLSTPAIPTRDEAIATACGMLEYANLVHVEGPGWKITDLNAIRRECATRSQDSPGDDQ